jgi:2-dehydro-3-deoxy-D-arabinonate dehydratase
VIVRFSAGAGAEIGWLEADRIRRLPVPSLAALLGSPLAEARAVIEAPAGSEVTLAECRLLAPVDEQEVWAAGVTYLRSRDARLEESGGAAIYDLVYEAERPELFFKSPGWRVVSPGDAIAIRADSSWNLPEPELAAVVNSRREIVGYTVGDDVSSRSIEGENALYLPQAKVYTRSCALGPGIVPAWQLDPAALEIELEVLRDGRIVERQACAVGQMKRSIPELVDWLFRALEFPVGAILMTGTGAVPGPEFSLRAGDSVAISIAGIGTLRNEVVEVGAAAPVEIGR